MIKKAAFFILLLTTIFTGTFAKTNATSAKTETIVLKNVGSSHFETVKIGDKTYLIEYDDSDGSIISIVEIDE